jgi:hypothetical protein
VLQTHYADRKSHNINYYITGVDIDKIGIICYCINNTSLKTKKKELNKMAERENPEHEKNITPSKEVIAEAYGDILKHNKDHTGFGVLFGNVIKTALKDEGVDIHVSDDIVAEGDMSAALQDVFHNDTFTRIGVNMGQFGSSSADAEGTPTTSKEIVPIVENQSLYMEFLGTLDSSDTENKQVSRLLSDVVTNLNKVVDFAFADESIAAISQDERAPLAEVGEDALRTFVAIDEEYARLGVDSVGLTKRSAAISDELKAALDEKLQYKYGGLSPELREEYTELQETKKQADVYASLSRKVDYWGRNILTEGIIADKKEYLVSPAEQGFGPTNWHKDGGQRHWAAAFGFLMQMQQGERTEEFGVEVKDGLLKSLDTALEEIEQSEEDLYYSGQKADLENVRSALNGDAYDVQRFMSYTQPSNYLR